MRAAWYERQGPARDVFTVGEMPEPTPSAGEVRVRIATSGVNPGDVKKRQDAFGYGMPFPRVVPHSDGAGLVDRVGSGVDDDWLGRRVWVYGAQSYRPFGTAAEFTVVPATQIVPLPEHVAMEQGACLGIPAITAHRAVHIAGPVDGRTVLVQGGTGAVGIAAIQLARRAGATVLATVRPSSRDEDDEAIATRAGAHHVLTLEAGLTDRVRDLAPDGVDHAIEVAFGENIGMDLELLAVGGSIAAYATGHPQPTIPFWPLLFKNTRIFLLGSDDFPAEAKAAAAAAITDALAGGWAGFDIAERFPLDRIADAHEWMEHPPRRGRVVVLVGG